MTELDVIYINLTFSNLYLTSNDSQTSWQAVAIFLVTSTANYNLNHSKPPHRRINVHINQEMNVRSRELNIMGATFSVWTEVPFVLMAHSCELSWLHLSRIKPSFDIFSCVACSHDSCHALNPPELNSMSHSNLFLGSGDVIIKPLYNHKLKSSQYGLTLVFNQVYCFSVP
jgi:hypothetical protein